MIFRIYFNFLYFNHIQTILLKIFTYSQPPSIFTHLDKVICIVPDSTTKSQRTQALMKFSTFGFLNVAVVHQASNSDITYETINAQQSSLTTLSNPENSLEIFPDKLKNLKGFQYEISAFDQPPSVNVNESFISSHMLHFLYALKDIQKASVKINFIRLPSDYQKTGLPKKKPMESRK